MCSRSRSQRGATLVEYTLLIAVLAVGTLAGINTLERGAERAVERASSHISTRSIVAGDPEPPDGSGGSSVPTITTIPTTTAPPPTTSTTTTTTRPPTTTTSTTTTTRPPTTTTTTTIPPASTVLAAWGATSTAKSGNQWRAQATLTLTDNRGARVSGASVRIGVRYNRNGSWLNASDISGTTGASGQLTFDSGLYARTGKPSDRVGQIRFTVELVSRSGLTYASGSISTTVDSP